MWTCPYCGEERPGSQSNSHLEMHRTLALHHPTVVPGPTPGEHAFVFTGMCRSEPQMTVADRRPVTLDEGYKTYLLRVTARGPEAIEHYG